MAFDFYYVVDLECDFISLSCFLLYLVGNAIGDAGAIAMAAALEKNSTLTDLNLSGESGC